MCNESSLDFGYNVTMKWKTEMAPRQIADAKVVYDRHCARCNGTKLDAFGHPVEMKLTFDQWMSIWWDSGHWLDRLTEKGGSIFVMGRVRDVGHYEIGNARIISTSENNKEQSTWCNLPPDDPLRPTVKYMSALQKANKEKANKVVSPKNKAIIEMYATGTFTQQEVAFHFGVSRPYVSLVVNGKR